MMFESSCVKTPVGCFILVFTQKWVVCLFTLRLQCSFIKNKKTKKQKNKKTKKQKNKKTKKIELIKL